MDKKIAQWHAQTSSPGRWIIVGGTYKPAPHSPPAGDAQVVVVAWELDLLRQGLERKCKCGCQRNTFVLDVFESERQSGADLR